MPLRHSPERPRIRLAKVTESVPKQGDGGKHLHARMGRCHTRRPQLSRKGRGKRHLRQTQ
eukprot:3154633-Alexandrium_andersonii.AAC.1